MITTHLFYLCDFFFFFTSFKCYRVHIFAHLHKTSVRIYWTVLTRLLLEIMMAPIEGTSQVLSLTHFAAQRLNWKAYGPLRTIQFIARNIRSKSGCFIYYKQKQQISILIYKHTSQAILDICQKSLLILTMISRASTCHNLYNYIYI